MATEDIRIEGKKMHIPHLGITLRTLNSVAAAHWSKVKGSRYYDVRCNNIHIAQLAVEVPKPEEKV